jgi:phosphoribosyl-ATP pyrophosphohydrolase/phosphoribosyl-AMP cyclohydrolase
MKIDFKKMEGLIPVVVQDAFTGKVLMLGYMNEAALAQTETTGRVTFFSRSKNRLWTKGETSGNFLELVSIQEDCDGDAILVKAKPLGPVCHTGADTCFDEVNQSSQTAFIDQLRGIIKERKENPSSASYTASLFAKGINKLAQKVGEEAVELVIEAKDDNKELFLGEAADLLFHYLVLLEAKGYELDEVVEVLKQRHKTE